MRAIFVLYNMSSVGLSIGRVHGFLVTRTTPSACDNALYVRFVKSVQCSFVDPPCAPLSYGMRASHILQSL